MRSKTLIQGLPKPQRSDFCKTPAPTNSAQKKVTKMSTHEIIHKIATASAALMIVGFASAASAADYQKEITNLIAFDIVDFVGWNNPDMEVLRKYHTDDVAVDMLATHSDGMDAHAKILQQIHDSGQANKIIQHLPKVAEGDWTAVGGITAKGSMATVVKWRDGKIAEEFLFLRPLSDSEVAAIDVSKPTVTITTPNDTELRTATGAEAGWSAVMGTDYVIFTHSVDGAVEKRIGFAVL